MTTPFPHPTVPPAPLTAPAGSLPTLERRLGLARAAVASLSDHTPTLARIIQGISARLAKGGTVYTAGNGGSAAEALHLAEELIGRYRTNRRPLRAACLAADPTALTCIANDFGFDEIFARPCEALLRSTDCLILFSTSGRSRNLIRAAEVARQKGAWVIGLLGGDGGPLLPQCDEAVVVAATPTQGVDAFDSAAVQEAHQVILHALCEQLEVDFPAA